MSLLVMDSTNSSMEKSARADVVVGVLLEKGSSFHNFFPFHTGHRNPKWRNISPSALFCRAVRVDGLSLDDVPLQPI